MMICKSRERSSASGFTLVEVAIATAILAVLVVAVWPLFNSTVSAVNHGVQSATLDGAIQRSLDRIGDELKDSGQDDAGTNFVTSHPTAATTDSATLTFQRRIGVQGTAADWGTAITYSLINSTGETPGNATDDDNDGVVDERQLVRTQNGAAVVLADGIIALNFRRNAGEFVVQIDITASRQLRLNEAPTIRAVTSRIALRNKP